GRRRIRQGWIPAVPPDNSRNCQTGGCYRPAVARICFAEGMGLRGSNFRFGNGDHLRLRVGRCREMDPAAGAPGACGSLLHNQASEPPIDWRQSALSEFEQRAPGLGISSYFYPTMKSPSSSRKNAKQDGLKVRAYFAALPPAARKRLKQMRE